MQNPVRDKLESAALRLDDFLNSSVAANLGPHERTSMISFVKGKTEVFLPLLQAGRGVPSSSQSRRLCLSARFLR